MLGKNFSDYVTLIGIFPCVVFTLILPVGCAEKVVVNEFSYRVVVSHGSEDIDLTRGVPVELINGISGLSTGKVANLKSDHDKCMPSSSKDSYFFSTHVGGGIYSCLFEVIQITNDRYRSVKNFIKEKDVTLYTDDFERGVIWIPTVCEYDIVECQKQINFLRNLTD